MPPFVNVPLLRLPRNLIFTVQLLAALAWGGSPQTIAFPAIPTQFLGVSPFPIAAHASSGLPVSFTSTTPAVCKSAGAWVLPLAPGSCSIQATQGGDSTWQAASPVVNTFAIQTPLPSGTMQFGIPTSAPAQPNSVAVADFDHDGFTDAAITTGNSNLTILFGGASGTASTSLVGLSSDTAWGVAVGDFNQDGKPDAVVATTDLTGGARLILVTGQDSRVFTPQTPVELGIATPTAITVGDFNGDGNQDVAVADQNGEVAILLGDGSGRLTLLSSTAIFAPTKITSIFSADFNHDGYMDLILACPDSDFVGIYTSDSTGAFSPLDTQPLVGGPTGPNALAVGDFDRDGNLDFAVTLGVTHQVAVFRGDASLGFQEHGPRYTVGTGPMSIATGDFDGNGNQDLAVGDRGTSSDGVYFLLGDGNGGFSNAGTQPEYAASSSGSIYIAVGDFNNDQREDVLALNGPAATLVVFTGAPATTTTTLSSTVTSPIAQGVPVPLTATVAFAGQSFGAVNGSVTFYDNENPLATVSGGSPYHYTAQSLTINSHNLTATYSGGGGGMASGSNTLSITVLQNQTISFPALNAQNYGDPAQDLLASSDSGLSVTYSTSTPSVCTPVALPSPHVNVLSVGSCSITASQPGSATYAPAPDITRTFTVGKSNQTITFSWPNGIHFAGTQPFLAPASSDSGLPVTIVSDTPAICKASGSLIQPISAGLCQLTATQAGNAFFNAAVSADAYTGIGVAAPSGKFSQTSLPLSTGDLPASAVTADFDGDGHMDLAVVNNNDHTVSVFLQHNPGVFGSGTAYPMNSAGDTIVAGDFNGDGFPDLAISSSSAKNVTVMLNSGGAFPETQGPVSLAAAPGGIALGDFNGDGITDLIVTEPSLGKIVIFAGDGHGSFAAYGNPVSAGVSPAAIAVADFDGDGKQDVVFIDTTLSQAIVLRGDGSGGFTPVTVGAPFAMSSSLFGIGVADFNNDGRPDFAISNASGLSVGVWLWNGVDGFNPVPNNPIATPAFAGPLALADFDGDQHIDIAVADPAGPVRLLLGDGSGHFTPALNTFAGGSGINFLVAGDIDGDGTIGLAAIDISTNKVTLLRGGQAPVTGALTSASAASVPYGTPIDLTLALNPDASAFRVPAGIAFFFDPDAGQFALSPDSSTPFHATVTTLAPGSYSMTGEYFSTGGTQSFTSEPVARTITQLSQTITFSPLSDRPFGSPQFLLDSSASVTSSLSLFFSTNTPSVCTVEGTVVTILAVGGCSITASQPGDFIHQAAEPQTQTFSVTPASQTITFDAIPARILGSAPFIAAAQSNSHLPVTLASTTSSVCTVSSTLVTLLATGTCTIHATQPGDANYGAAPVASQSFSVIRSSAAGTMSSASAPISVGRGPYAIAVGDFNNDGLPDFATANDQANTVTVALAHASSSYAADVSAPIPVGNSPISIAAGDFNGDGCIDLVTADQADGKLTVLLGDCFGGFNPLSQRPAVGNAPSYVAVVDLNGDAIPDLAVANSLDNTVSLLKGDGTGSFTAFGSPVSVGRNPGAIAVGDFDKDGSQDLAVTNSDADTITILRGDGNGGMTRAETGLTTGAHPLGISVLDYDNDGNPDLAVANTNAATVSLFHGNGTGAFTGAATLSVGSIPAIIVAGDFNGDGNPDLATANVAGNNVSVLLGDSHGAFAVKSLGAGSQPYALAEFDFNGDGFDDLAVTNIASNNVSILLGGLAGSESVLSTASPSDIPANSTVSLTVNVTNPNGAFAPPTGTVTFRDGDFLLGTSPDSASPFTFTTPPLGHGPHAITAYYSGGAGSDLSSSNTLQFSARSTQTITFNALSDRPMDPLPIPLTAVADSGLGVSYVSNTVSVCKVTSNLLTLIGIGQCSITASQPGNSDYQAAAPVTQSFNISVAVQTIHFTDVLNPSLGLPPFEIPVQASSLLPVSVTSITPSICRAASNLVTLLAAGSCTLQASQAGNANYNPSPLVQTTFEVKRAAPSGRFAPQPTISVSPAEPYTIAAGDFDHDGFTDLVFASTSTNSVSVLLNDHAGGFHPVAGNFPAGTAPTAIAAGDFNADGYADVAVSSSSDGSLSILLGGPGGALSTASGSPFAAGTNAYAIVVGDFNGDGIEDLATTNGAGGKVIVFAGDGQGGFSQLSQIPVGGTLQAITVADLDNNGTQDLAAVDVANSKVFVLLGNGHGGFSVSAGLAAGTAPVAVSAGDFNADGISDLAVVNEGGNNITLLVGDTAGGFTPATIPDTGSFPDTLAVGDFNGDGLPDLGVGFVNNGSGFTVLANNGSLHFTRAAGSPFPMPLPYAAVTGDFNNDGRLDLASINAGLTVSVLLGSATSTS
ncbi:MAG TPA: FG-GAP-like repeat-containing protein, partial [Bryobacteraceae bacterium]|nr:FG-GAP-like repeat-containing protein [Bryobacteraceae bacterium]